MPTTTYKYQAIINKSKMKKEIEKANKSNVLNPEQTNNIDDFNRRKQDLLRPVEFLQIDILEQILGELKRINKK